MKILNINQIRAVDLHTIENEPITSIDLMEKACGSFTDWMLENIPIDQKIHIICGLGNNGGDGLGIARLLTQVTYQVEVYIVRYSQKFSEDFAINEQQLRAMDTVQIHDISTINELPEFEKEAIIIDAIFGSGLSRPIKGMIAAVVEKINESEATVLAVDIPSGLYMDKQSEGAIVKADYTISFELIKLAFLLPQHEQYVGDWCLVPVGFDKAFIAQQKTKFHFLEETDIQKLVRKKSKFSHKGTNGHALIIGGSYGMMGACLLGSKCCVKAGAGKVTAYIPKCGYDVLQIAVPEVMVITDGEYKHLSVLPIIHRESTTVKEVWKNAIAPVTIRKPKYEAIGVGIGMGKAAKTQDMLLDLLRQSKQPLVLDADALNIISMNDWLQYVPENSILTPHPKEFKRLLGLADKWLNDYDMLEKLVAMAHKYKIYIALKGHHTAIACPDGNCYFNSTGNPAMATAGSGDTLLGIITAFMAQGYDSKSSAILGVYFHGKAGDYAAEAKGGNILARDLIDFYKM